MVLSILQVTVFMSAVITLWVVTISVGRWIHVAALSHTRPAPAKQEASVL